MQFLKNKTYLLLIIALSLFVYACERDGETEGPNLVDLYGEFSVLDPFEVSQDKVDFAAGESVHFTARFSNIIDWKLTITGQSTGAIKTIEGKSKSIDNTSSLWLGETTELPIFGVEECRAQLSIANDSLQFEKIIKIETIKVLEDVLVLANFENGWNDNWETFVQSGTDMSFNITDTDPSAEGLFYYDMGGEVDWDWLIGMIEFPASAYGANTYDLNPNGTDVYFNTMLYLPSGVTNPVMLFQFREDENGDEAFDEATEDMYAVEVKAGDLEVGWNLYSIKYSDLTALVNGAPAEPNGNGNHEPDKLWRVSCLFLANPSSGYAQAYMDYVVFSQGGPLIP